MYEKSDNLKEKEIEWQRKLEELGEVGDALGEGIDERIKETVAAFNLAGFHTDSSCEGHLDWGTGAPWIGVEAAGEPEERFTGEKEVVEKIAKKAQNMLNEFYKDRNMSADSKLAIEGVGGGGAFRIHNGGEDYEVMLKNMPETQKNGLAERLQKHQAEMRAFGEFLKDKFFNS